MSLIPGFRGAPTLLRKLLPATAARLGFPSRRSLYSYEDPQPYFISLDGDTHFTKWGAYGAAAALVGFGSYKTFKAWRSSTPREHDVISEIVEVLGRDKVDVSLKARQVRSRDSYSFHTGELPTLIVYPASTEDVVKITTICNKYKTPLIPSCSGTSLSGHTLALEAGSVVCCLSRMNRVITVNEKDGDVEIQAGVSWQELNRKLEHTGLFFPMDAGPGAALGGMFGTGCSGTNALRYGTMRDWVLRATVVMADGKVVKLGTRARKDVAGYDLIRLFVGSEGTLGIVTELTLKLAARPRHEVISLYSFPSASAACEAVYRVLKSGLQITGAEFMDPVAVRVLKSSRENLVGNLEETHTVMFDCCAGSPAQLLEAQRLIEELCKTGGGAKGVERNTTEEGGEEAVKRLWFARKTLLADAAKKWKEREAWITDVCVPISQLPALVEGVLEDLKEHPSVIAPLFGHVGDGNFHAQLFFKPTDLPIAKKLSDRMSERAIAMGGTCTGEHGIGVGKKDLLKKQASPEALVLMKTIKKSLDPSLILNRGKIFDL